MITINLLPYELRPIKRTPVPYIAGAALAVVVLLAVAFLYLGSRGAINQAEATLTANKTELASLQQFVQERNDLTRQKNALAEQVKTIEEITSDRIIWSRQLYNLSRLAADNLWYSGIRVEMKPFPVMRQIYDKKTKTNKTVRETVKKQVLTISGYVTPGDDGKMSIYPLTLKLEGDEEFSNMFDINSSPFEDTEFDGVQVRKFDLEYVVKPPGAPEK